MNILITGAKGFIGRALKSCLRHEHEVHALGHRSLDLTNPVALKNFFEKNDIDIVLHTAIKGGRRNKKDK